MTDGPKKPNNLPLTLALLGGGLVLVGCVTPLVHVPILGGVSLLESGGGYAVPLFAMVAIVLAAVRHFRWLMLPAVVTGLAALLQLAVVAMNVDDLSFYRSGWEWLLIFGGVGLLVASSIAGWKR